MYEGDGHAASERGWRERGVGGSPFDFDPRRWPRDGTLATRVPRKSPRLGGWSAIEPFLRFAADRAYIQGI